MAKLDTPFHFTGTIDGITYYKMGGKYYARKKGGPNRKQVLHSSSYANTRKQMVDFGRIAQANKLLRDSLAEFIYSFVSVSLIGQLTKRLISVINEDDFHEVGSRQLMSGDPSLLKGFDFNEASPMGAVFSASYTSVIDRITGKAAMQIPAFKPQEYIKAPKSATHFSVHLVGLSADLDSLEVEVKVTEQGIFPMKKLSPVMVLEFKLPPPGKKVMLLVLVIKFFDTALNGSSTHVAAGARDMVSIIDVK